ncbi:NAD dependent epimerase/dehydratase family protein [Leptodontidium sp. 2 PMI_412]|nr:hypothetical protein BKA61DRAFT_731741 [Leptodontidium sp. MPI-SDFR-AT-0119]KAH9222625.1 NAD dependent epimerase/dehydratase family protein [Leptodontidium sp. 2 PMI_412]
MVNVLVIGATGYIGQALTQSLIRSGDHRIFGLARTPEKAKTLEREEVIPIYGAISSTEALTKAIETHHINIVVDVAGADKESHDLLGLLKKIGTERLAVASKAGIRTPKLGFIYCGGTWVHGSSQAPVNDLMPVATLNAPSPSMALTSWRPALEQAVLASSDVLDVMVIRPALVYGRSSAIWTSLLHPIHAAAQSGSKTVSVAAELDSRPALIHVDDVATGFHAAIDKLTLISGTGVYPIFDLVTSQESMHDILSAAGRELGLKGTVELAGCGENSFAKAMSCSGNATSGRARRILGWEPKKYSFVQGMDVYAKAWLAGQ